MMKRIQIFTLGVIALATFISCKKDNDEQDAQALVGKGGNEQIALPLPIVYGVAAETAIKRRLLESLLMQRTPHTLLSKTWMAQSD